MSTLKFCDLNSHFFAPFLPCLSLCIHTVSIRSPIVLCSLVSLMRQLFGNCLPLKVFTILLSGFLIAVFFCNSVCLGTLKVFHNFARYFPYCGCITFWNSPLRLLKFLHNFSPSGFLIAVSQLAILQRPQFLLLNRQTFNVLPELCSSWKW